MSHREEPRGGSSFFGREGSFARLVMVELERMFWNLSIRLIEIAEPQRR
jgi:hypothetical protein